MTNDDVIDAAFRVWGQEFYKTTSLAGLAEALRVSKPALYRHFSSKQALLEAMEERFYDDYTAAIKPALEDALKIDNWKERLLAVGRFITGYFALHIHYLIYALVRVHSAKEHRFFDPRLMAKRGVVFPESAFLGSGDKQYPSALFLTAFTAFCGTAVFHRGLYGLSDMASPMKDCELSKLSWRSPSAEEVAAFIEATVERIRLGLGFDRKRIEDLPYKKLEMLDTAPRTPPDPLLKAVAEAVAEEGLWKASMETAARRSGLSKSGLYAHFKSKRDMLSRLFSTEFERVAECVCSSIALSEIPEEQLYLAILSIAGYLRARPEILIAMDWVRIQRLELDISPPPPALYQFFASFKPKRATGTVWENIPLWIPFLLVAMMKTRKTEDPDRKDLRKLFKFVCLGIEGL